MNIKVFLSIGAIMLFWGIFALGALDLQFTTDITISPCSANTGEMVRFIVSFKPVGAAVTDLKIVGGIEQTQIFERTYASIGADLTRTDSFTWTATAGLHTIYFQIDPDKDQQGETENDRNNNIIKKVLYIGEGKDLKFTSDEIIIQPDSLINGLPATFTASFQTASQYVTSPHIKVSIDGTEKSNCSYDYLSAGSIRQMAYTWTAVEGNHTVSFELIPNSEGDSNYCNNRIEKTITVNNQSSFDLRFTTPISQSSDNINPADVVKFSADFINAGNTSINNLTVAGWIENTVTNIITQFSEQNFNFLEANAVTPYFIEWTAPNDIQNMAYKVRFEIDYHSEQTNEVDTENNSLEKQIIGVGKPDLILEGTTITDNQGQKKFYIISKNIGSKDSSTCKLSIKSVAMSIPQIITLVDEQSIPVIRSGEQFVLIDDHFPPNCGFFYYEFAIDADALNNESNENNNTWRAGFLCPDAIFHLLWEQYRFPSTDDSYLPVPCHTCPQWHDNMRKGDPVMILDNIGKNLGQGKNYDSIKNSWMSFLDKNNGLKPNSALKIIFDQAVQVAKIRLKNKADIKTFQESLNNSIIQMAALAKKKLAIQ